MPYQLRHRNVLVTGGSRGLGALICQKFAREGANVMINYVSSEDHAKTVAKQVEAYGVKAFITQGDTGIPDDNFRIVKETVDKLGGLDIIVANAAWTKVCDFQDLSSMSDEEWNKCWSTNVICHLKLMQAAAPIFSANPDGGVYLISSSISAKTQAGSSMAYSVTKAAGLHLMKCFAATQAPTRVNAVLPGLLLTDWSARFSNENIAESKGKAVLKHETFLDDCADAYIYIARNTSMTGQCVTVDAGLAPF